MRAGDTKRHYEQFVVEALAMDRLAARQSPQRNHIAGREWSREPVKLFATMYELTEAVCHNYWCVNTVLDFLFAFVRWLSSGPLGAGVHPRLLTQRLGQVVELPGGEVDRLGMSLARSALSIMEASSARV